MTASLAWNTPAVPVCSVGGIGCKELELRDTIQTWRDLAMAWRNIAAVLICPDDDGIERLAWASGEGWDALAERTDAALKDLRPDD